MIGKLTVSHAASGTLCLFHAGCSAAGVSQSLTVLKGICSLESALTGLVIYSLVKAGRGGL